MSNDNDRCLDHLLQIGAYFNAIILKKENSNTFGADTGRKRQQINTKENFWPATARSKNAVEAWFKDLAASKPLNSLSKKVPFSPATYCYFIELFFHLM